MKSLLEGDAGLGGIYKQNTEFFKVWRMCDLGCSLFSTLALITCTFDYEYNYPKARTYSNCHEDYIELEGFRYLTLLLSLLSILFVSVRFYYKSLWVRTMNKLNQVNLKFGKKKVVRLPSVMLEILLLLFIPYPNMNVSIMIPLRLHNETKLTCYTVAELFYCVMFLRCFFIIRSISNYSSFQNEWAWLSCQKNKTKPGFIFAFKCLLRTRPTFMIILLFLMLLLFSATVYRVVERPLDEFSLEYNSDPLTPMWVIFATIGTIGYGDLYPLSYFGRVIIVLSYLVGAIIMSLLLIKMQQVTCLKQDEKQVFERSSVTQTAAKFIASGLKYFLLKKKCEPGDPVVFISFFEMQKRKRAFSSIRNRVRVAGFSMSDYLYSIHKQVAMAKLQLRVCSSELDKHISLISQF